MRRAPKKSQEELGKRKIYIYFRDTLNNNTCEKNGGRNEKSITLLTKEDICHSAPTAMEVVRVKREDKQEKGGFPKIILSLTVDKPASVAL